MHCYSYIADFCVVSRCPPASLGYSAGLSSGGLLSREQIDIYSMLQCLDNSGRRYDWEPCRSLRVHNFIARILPSTLHQRYPPIHPR